MKVVLDILILAVVIVGFVLLVRKFVPGWFDKFKASLARILGRLIGKKPDSGSGGGGGGTPPGGGGGIIKPR